MIRKLLLLLLCIASLTATAKKRKSVENQTSKIEIEDAKTKQSAYSKLFKDKHTIETGMLIIHNVKGSIYFEIPDSLFGREMLLGSTITEISDNASGTIGSKSGDPKHIMLTRDELFVQFREVNSETVTDQKDAGSNLNTAVRLNNANPIFRNYKISAVNKDNANVVINVTDFFVGDIDWMSPFSEYGLYSGYTLKKTFQKENSMLGEIKAFADNVMIRSTLSYVFTLSRSNRVLIKDKPLTAVMTRSMVLLPKKPYRPRLTDPRMSVFPTYKLMFSDKEQRSKDIYFANRWRVEPADVDAFVRGEKVQVKQPIIFYVDNNFPEKWKKHIFEAVEQWKEPFEAIGLLNAIEAREYPIGNHEFDPDNIKFSCIRYAPVAIANAMGPSWVDPRSGEILNASVYVYHDVIKLLNNWMFIQTSQADKRVRKVILPDDVIGDGLRYVIAHEVGHCLGYMHNMSGSAVIPVDSLRSPSFTQKHGTTTTIMDYARFNYVAQPGDLERGVKLTPPRFGIYDFYAVKWLYAPLPQCASPEEEYAITSRWITEASADSVFRFGKQQFVQTIDPKSQSEDLGDDAVKASEYGIENLKYILSNMNEWLVEEDPDYSQRSELYDGIVFQYVRYLNHVLANLGGVYLNEKMEGDPVVSYQSVPREKQKKALEFALRQLRDMDWLDNEELMRNLPIMGSPKESILTSLITVVVAAPKRVAMSAALAGTEAYAPSECRQDVYNFIWNPVTKGRNSLLKSEMMLQREYVKSLTLLSGLKYTGTGAKEERKITDAMNLVETPEYLKEYSSKESLLSECAHCDDVFSGRLDDKQWLSKISLSYSSPFIRYYGQENVEADNYTALLKLRDMLRSRALKSTGYTQRHYALLVRNIDVALNK